MSDGAPPLKKRRRRGPNQTKGPTMVVQHPAVPPPDFGVAHGTATATGASETTAPASAYRLLPTAPTPLFSHSGALGGTQTTTGGQRPTVSQAYNTGHASNGLDLLAQAANHPAWQVIFLYLPYLTYVRS